MNRAQIRVLGIALVMLQVADGVLTYIGVTKKVASEGNPILAYFMHEYGVLETLLVAKVLAIFIVIILTRLAMHNAAVRQGLIFIAVIYTSLAILPWSILLLR